MAHSGFHRAIGVLHLKHHALPGREAGAGNGDRFSRKVAFFVRAYDRTGVRAAPAESLPDAGLLCEHAEHEHGRHDTNR